MRYRILESICVIAALAATGAGNAALAQADPEDAGNADALPTEQIRGMGESAELPAHAAVPWGAAELPPEVAALLDAAALPGAVAVPGAGTPRPDAAAVPDACAERPWYCGVSEDEQGRALALYQDGNVLFDDSLFAGAADNYQAALEHWDHPGIHYNLMMALVALERPIEAYESSVAALRFGPDALQPEEYQRALDYQKLLRGRLAELEVHCDQPGAVVSLDGEELFRGPGSGRRFVLPGKYELVARKPGYLTAHQTVLLLPDQPTDVRVTMLPADQAMLTTQRWERWKPWAVVGAGVGLGILGGALEWRASVNNEAFKALFDTECPPPDGCFRRGFSAAMESRQLRATWYRRLGYGVAAAGAGAAITGLVLVYANRPQQIENPARHRQFEVSVAPMVTGESAEVEVRVDF